MPKKKTARGKAKTSRTVTKRSTAPDYPCPNPGRPLGVEAIVKKMQSDPGFARFIRDLLCRVHRGDQTAVPCLDSYYKPAKSELSALCLPEARYMSLTTCTDITTNLLIDVPASIFSRE